MSYEFDIGWMCKFDLSKWVEINGYIVGFVFLFVGGGLGGVGGVFGIVGNLSGELCEFWVVVFGWFDGIEDKISVVSDMMVVYLV